MMGGKLVNADDLYTFNGAYTHTKLTPRGWCGLMNDESMNLIAMESTTPDPIRNRSKRGTKEN